MLRFKTLILSLKKKFTTLRDAKMPQWVKGFTSKPYNLSLIPGTHMVEKERTTFCILFSDTRTCVVGITRPQLYYING